MCNGAEGRYVRFETEKKWYCPNGNVDSRVRPRDFTVITWNEKLISQGSLPKERRFVAIVDDELGVLRGLKRLLDASGFIAEVFRSGEEFLQSLRVSDAACVVLDIHLDGMSGIETRRALTARGLEIPVIFMTGCDSADLRQTALESGCVSYLQKPFSADALLDAIRGATSVT